MISNKQLAELLAEHYFSRRKLELEIVRTGVRANYFRAFDGAKSYFIKIYADGLEHPDRFQWLRTETPGLLSICSTLTGQAFVEVESEVVFVFPFIEGREFDVNSDDALPLAQQLGKINKQFAHVKTVYGRRGYNGVEHIQLTQSVVDLFKAKYQIELSQADIETVVENKMRLEKLNRPLAFEYLDCHPLNILVSKKGPIFIDVDSFFTSYQGTSISTLIERFARDANMAHVLWVDYCKASDLKLSYEEVLDSAKFETLQRIGYILNEIQTTGQTKWSKDMIKHIGNLNKIQKFQNI